MNTYGFLMRKILGIFLLLISQLAASAAPKPSELAATQVVDHFVQGCFMNFPYPEKFARWISQPGFKKLSGNDAEEYLSGYSGSVWTAELNSSRFVVTSIGVNACNVFANDVDEAMTKNLVTGFLDYLKTQGVTYQAKNITPNGAKAGQSSTSYAVSIEGQVIMNLILSIAPPGLGKFQIALTTVKVDT